jgi:hypothetical protein
MHIFDLQESLLLSLLPLLFGMPTVTHCPPNICQMQLPILIFSFAFLLPQVVSALLQVSSTLLPLISSFLLPLSFSLPQYFAMS